MDTNFPQATMAAAALPEVSREHALAREAGFRWVEGELSFCLRRCRQPVAGNSGCTGVFALRLDHATRTACGSCKGVRARAAKRARAEALPPDTWRSAAKAFVGGESAPQRAHTACLGGDGVPAALVARCNSPLLLHLAAVEAPASLRAELPGCRHEEACACSANPVFILGGRRELYASDKRSQRLFGWLMNQPNPADGGRPFKVAWDELDAALDAKAGAAALRMGLPQRLVDRLVFSSRCLIESGVTRGAGDTGGVPLPAACPGQAKQAAHLDHKRLQCTFNMGVQPCEATSVYTGEYATEGWGDRTAARSPAEEANHQAKLAEGDAELRAAAATLFKPRADLEAQLRPAAPRLLAPGEGSAFWGPTIHAGAGTAAGEWRCIVFFTAHPEGEAAYDADTQFSPWSAALDLYHSASLVERMAIEYNDYGPSRNFSGALGKAVERLGRVPAALLRATAGGAA